MDTLPAPKKVYSPCLNPLTIHKRILNTDSGELKEFEFEKRCGSRRKDKCEPCSIIWKDDAYFTLLEPSKNHKGSLTFITLTAPGAWFFGASHTAQFQGKPSERCACRKYHKPDDSIVGTPVESDDFDYDKIVEFNNKVSRLTTVTLQKIYRLLVTDLNNKLPLSVPKTIKDVRLPTARVMEWQERGVLHVHIIVRGYIPTYIIENAVKGSSANRTRRRIEPSSYRNEFWGNQLDVKHINSDDISQLKKLSCYVIKVVNYALKDVKTDSVAKSIQKEIYYSRLRKWTNRVIKCDKPFSVCNASNLATQENIVSLPTIKNKVFCVKHRRGHHQIGFTGNVLTLNRTWGATLKQARERRQNYAKKASQMVRTADKAGRLDYVKKLVTHVVVRKDKNIRNFLLAKSKRLQTVIDGGIRPPDNK